MSLFQWDLDDHMKQFEHGNLVCQKKDIKYMRASFIRIASKDN